MTNNSESRAKTSDTSESQSGSNTQMNQPHEPGSHESGGSQAKRPNQSGAATQMSGKQGSDTGTNVTNATRHPGEHNRNEPGATSSGGQHSNAGNTGFSGGQASPKSGGSGQSAGAGKSPGSGGSAHSGSADRNS